MAMTHTTRPINVTPGSELDQLLQEASHAPLLLDRDGVLYRLARADADDMRAAYDPAAALAGIRDAAGSWSDLDAEAFKASVYRAREAGTRLDR